MLEGVTASSGIVDMIDRADTRGLWYIPGSGIQSSGYQGSLYEPER